MTIVALALAGCNGAPIETIKTGAGGGAADGGTATGGGSAAGGGSALLADGRPCTSNDQCAGGTCYTEAQTGAPGGTCTSLVCDPSTNAGCTAGAVCATFQGATRCFQACTGTGLGPGGCRAGYSCYDLDGTPGNNNNFCVIDCDSDQECTGSGANYGCNPYSHTCTTKDRGRAHYGATCSKNSDCETDHCSSTLPDGYCVGLCRGDLKNCGTGGSCVYTFAQGDNTGGCFASCNTSTNPCPRQNYACMPIDQTTICYCFQPGQPCVFDSQCCSGTCSSLNSCQ